jgi:ribosomal protein S18 acetylase RimI-like enzyme
MSKSSIRKANLSDVTLLSKLASETYLATYVPMNPHKEELLKSFVSENLGHKKIQQDLQDPKITFYLLELNQVLTAYAKIVWNEVDRVLELDKLYVQKECQGQGLGERLFKEVKEASVNFGARSIQLSVYDQNKASIDFYLKRGFKKIGEKSFLFDGVGSSYQERDWLMELTLY